MSARAARPVPTATRRSWRARGWWIGGAVGLLAGTGAAVLVLDHQESREAADTARRAEVFGRREVVPPPGDAVRALVEQDTLVAVDPLLAGRVPEADRAQAEAILARSPVPSRIAFLRYPRGVYEGYTNTGAAAQWHEAVGERGYYVVLWDSGSTESGAVGLEDPFVGTRTQGQPGPALVRLAEEMVTWEAQPLPTRPDAPSSQDYWGGIGGGIAAALLMGAFGVLPLFLLLRWYVGSRRLRET
ncbi:hypothetical protein [Nocardioides sp. LHG3406-4]|uniref:hypothetical protein n=1 Tax=Nocardioides sp. LHG3406-4 TaxID=2804575 RepID=UPI003CE94D14